MGWRPATEVRDLEAADYADLARELRSFQAGPHAATTRAASAIERLLADREDRREAPCQHCEVPEAHEDVEAQTLFQ